MITIIVIMKWANFLFRYQIVYGLHNNIRTIVKIGTDEQAMDSHVPYSYSMAVISAKRFVHIKCKNKMNPLQTHK